METSRDEPIDQPAARLPLASLSSRLLVREAAMTEGAVGQLPRRATLRDRLRQAVRAIGYDTTDWVRSAMYASCFDFIRSLDPSTLDTLEVSGGPQWVREFQFKSYETTNFPDYDVCATVLPRQFDLIIADQVFEHLPWPYRAGRNIFAMLRPGGHAIIATPFLIRVHRSPIDCSRWTAEGLGYLLQECGFSADDIQTFGWGNRDCVKANLTSWPKRGFTGSLKNEADYPVMVWAFAQRALV